MYASSCKVGIDDIGFCVCVNNIVHMILLELGCVHEMSFARWRHFITARRSDCGYLVPTGST